jgi:hypothetical protein
VRSAARRLILPCLASSSGPKLYNELSAYFSGRLKASVGGKNTCRPEFCCLDFNVAPIRAPETVRKVTPTVRAILRRLRRGSIIIYLRLTDLRLSFSVL